ncbi:hypothetical protein KFK09_027737 [Dendrobium nobile]|uniref:Uncharacterized protein n=1 Tax=Dendrobium nobile TaxID=94219 RepID=A0A8T3A0D0_DENNO|nr:hypothetical protein KFK09_027737 [Dendrobium nobile]
MKCEHWALTFSRAEFNNSFVQSLVEAIKEEEGYCFGRRGLVRFRWIKKRSWSFFNEDRRLKGMFGHGIDRGAETHSWGAGGLVRVEQVELASVDKQRVGECAQVGGRVGRKRMGSGLESGLREQKTKVGSAGFSQALAIHAGVEVAYGWCGPLFLFQVDKAANASKPMFFYHHASPLSLLLFGIFFELLCEEFGMKLPVLLFIIYGKPAFLHSCHYITIKGGDMKDW